MRYIVSLVGKLVGLPILVELPKLTLDKEFYWKLARFGGGNYGKTRRSHN